VIVRSLLVLTAFGLLAPLASAETIYTESYTGTGSLDGFNFVSVVLSATADPNNVVGPVTFQGGTNPNTFVLVTPVTITATLADGSTVTDILSGSLTGDVGVFDSQSGQSNVTGSVGAAGFFDNYQGRAAVVMATVDSHFNSYDLKSFITETNTALSTGNYYNTATGGFLVFDAIPNGAVSTFTASVPEPSSIAMTAIALLIGGGAQWRRMRKASAR
jgi:hypothetical protein